MDNDTPAIAIVYPFAHNVYGQQATARAAELAEAHPGARIYIFPLRADLFAVAVYKDDHSVITSVCCPPAHLAEAMLIAAREVLPAPPTPATGV